MTSRLPSTFKKLSVLKITNKFKDAVKLVTNPLPQPGQGELLVKNRYLGVNASDINYTAGRYDTTVRPPFDCGFEGVGEVVATGPECRNIKVGQSVAYIEIGAFAEYTVVKENYAMPVPQIKSDYVPLLVSGLTAIISLNKVGEIKKGENVLVTAAAGGTGQFAVQLAKLAGCHVIGTCSTDAKVDMLKKIGCDRPINSTTENLKDVLRKEYPNGIDVIYETIGGEVFDTCIDALAIKGRLISIGFIEAYETAMGLPRSKKASLLPILMLRKSCSVRGFFLNHFYKDWAPNLQELVKLYEQGNIKCITDNGINSPHGPFQGVQSIEKAVDYLYTRKSVGKIVVEIPESEEKPFYRGYSRL